MRPVASNFALSVYPRRRLVYAIVISLFTDLVLVWYTAKLSSWRKCIVLLMSVRLYAICMGEGEAWSHQQQKPRDKKTFSSIIQCMTIYVVKRRLCDSVKLHVKLERAISNTPKLILRKQPISFPSGWMCQCIIVRILHFSQGISGMKDSLQIVVFCLGSGYLKIVFHSGPWSNRDRRTTFGIWFLVGTEIRLHFDQSDLLLHSHRPNRLIFWTQQSILDVIYDSPGISDPCLSIRTMPRGQTLT